MKKIAFILCAISVCQPAFADRLCTQKSTGKILEYQADATDGTLTQNAINAGYLASDVQETQITKDDWNNVYNPQLKAQNAALQTDQNATLKTKIDTALASVIVPKEVKDVLTEWKKKL